MSKMEMPFIVVELSKQQDYFVTHHMIEKQLPTGWQFFFEKEFKIKSPDCY